ncbi:ribonuclease P protein subunit p25-like protein [Onthophagus taurus]|uniref:ribonuclease P protein subunit p25-like protein n=1 Tax=Onthophagus taurus TaxID=166361 RepID=UPI0039BDB4A4
MNNYVKGKNCEQPLLKEKIPISNLPSDFLWMQVRGGSKIRNLLTTALKEFPEKKSVVWTGFGASVGKTITCAEIMKREYKHTLHQITKISFKLIEEYWDPIIPELDQLVVKRQIPMINILLSLDPLDEKELGYQSPGKTLQYLPDTRKQKRNQKNFKGSNKNNKFKSKEEKINKNQTQR